MSKKAKRRSLIWFLLGTIVIVQTGCASVHASRQDAPELLKPVKRQEDVYTVASGSIAKQIRGLGVLVPAETTFYQHPTGGKIAAIHAYPGDTVKKGDVLIELDPNGLDMKIVEQKLVVAKAEDQLEQAKSSRDSELLRLAGLNLEVERMKLADLEAKLAGTKIRAKSDGTVTFLDFVQPGDSLAAYKAVIGVSPPGRYNVMYTVPIGGDLSAAVNGMEAEIVIGGSAHKGKIIQTPRSAPFSENPIQSEINSRSLLIAPEALPPDAKLGDMVELAIVTDRKDNVLIIPRVGLRSYQGRSFVVVKDGDARKEVDVEKGLETATEVEIRKGLKEGQQIVLNN